MIYHILLSRDYPLTMTELVYGSFVFEQDEFLKSVVSDRTAIDNTVCGYIWKVDCSPEQFTLLILKCPYNIEVYSNNDLRYKD